ncbi:MAG: threonylcarbamoyl-AMP synthase [Deltaproteobacteria bacterium]|nr:threonylcarbamoyl-AMP synthase [Deltaproteobacteria bacterium]
MVDFRVYLMSCRLLKIDEKNFEKVIKKAGKVVLSGGVVAMPTESFYGLAVNALNVEAIERLLQIKKRREDHPILILIPSSEALSRYVKRIPPVARKLMETFWPGGLTMVFEAGPILPSLLTGGTGEIGVRLSSHPVPTELARVAGVAITGTSANITGEPPCTNSEEVLKALGAQIDLILDGGKTSGGKGSTVLDVAVTPPVILREGMVTRKALAPLL